MQRHIEQTALSVLSNGRQIADLAQRILCDLVMEEFTPFFGKQDFIAVDEGEAPGRGKVVQQHFLFEKLRRLGLHRHCPEKQQKRKSGDTPGQSHPVLFVLSLGCIWVVWVHIGLIECGLCDITGMYSGKPRSVKPDKPW
jgi:hypothetical protein